MHQNRISSYEVGWLSLLVVNGLATKAAIRSALDHRAADEGRTPGNASLRALHEARVARLQQREQERRADRERRRSG
ncbi:MAG: hypothetical protein EBR86_03690 [Planctomycetia bacterium]|nr:hypothetical protein [Planctomycetia bacterium]